MTWTTADLSDAHPTVAALSTEKLRHFGRQPSFCGPIRTVQVFEDNTSVRALLETAGNGAVLVVDGGGSTRCALVGDQLATLAIDNGWSGLVVWGAIRDSAIIGTMPTSIVAMATSPKKSEKRGAGIVDQPVWFAGAQFTPGAWLSGDPDGILISPEQLHR